MLEEAVRTVDRLDRLEAQARAAKQADLKVAVEQDAEEREEVARWVQRVTPQHGYRRARVDLSSTAGYSLSASGCRTVQQSP